MRNILKQNNLHLLKEIKTLQEAIETNENNLPEELSDYHRWIINTCKTLAIKIHKNLDNLSLPIENILDNILKNTQNLTRHFDIINTRSSKGSSLLLVSSKGSSLLLTA